MMRSLAFACCVALVGGNTALAAAPVKTERVPAEPQVVAPEKPNGPAAAAALPEVRYGPEALPERVRAMRQKILDAVYSGDIANLKPVIQQNELPPSFSVNDVGDPVEFLTSQSGDGEGREILAILSDVLESGWVHLNPGQPGEMYVWPYFAEFPIDKLEGKQMVELFKIVTSADFEEMKALGKYVFYRVGIGPDGTWHYFKTGEE